MVKIICQYSGIEFEAKTSRAKNHPKVSELLNTAHRDGNYGKVANLLKEAKSAKLLSIEEVLRFVQDGLTNEKQKQAARLAKQREEDAELARFRAERKARRQAQNEHLKAHGYNWSKNYAYDFDHYEEPDDTFVWELHSLDGRIMTVDQALDEIKRGADVVLAEIEAEKQAEAEAEASRKAAEEAEQAAYQAARDEVRSIEVAWFDYNGFDLIYNKTDYGAATIISRIYRGKINGVKSVLVYHYFGGHDFMETKSFYCDDPEAAGLVRLEREGLSKTLSDFWG